MLPSVSEKMRWLAHDRIRRQILRSQQRLQLVGGNLLDRGDRARTCRYNAGSAFLLCAVHPYGPCAGCPDYAPITSETPTP